MTKNEKAILDDLIKVLKDYEDECYRQMAYMNKHKFEMEREAIRYKQEAFNRSWLEVASAVDKIIDMNQETSGKDESSAVRWKRMENGVAGNSGHDIYLIRSSKGHYFTSSCIGGPSYYLELEELEKLPGIKKGE